MGGDTSAPYFLTQKNFSPNAGGQFSLPKLNSTVQEMGSEDNIGNGRSSNSSMTKIERRNKKVFKAVLKKSIAPPRAQSELMITD